MGAVPGYTRTTSLVERNGSTATNTVYSLVAKDDKERRQAQFRSKSMVWKEPMLLLQRMSSRKVVKSGSRSFNQRDGQELSHGRLSKWTRFWKKLRFDGVGQKVHAARPEWLNYDAQSYAMNFEKDRESSATTGQKMPKISGPGAREIVTVLLTRSSSTNRNSGCILIPKPVSAPRQEANAPLWKRRSVRAPSLLDVRMRASTTKRRTAVSGA
ncbi:unnamed protein product [Calypogeia fissa]